jgi:predicted nucleotidyltransferase
MLENTTRVVYPCIRKGNEPMEKILRYQRDVLKILAWKLGGFYLAGGTALANYHFQHHRESYDLDLFSKDYTSKQVDALVDWIEMQTGKVMEKVAGQKKKKEGLVRHSHYDLVIGPGNALRIDFVEDVEELLEPPMEVNGVPVLSLPDLYLRKIDAAAGMVEKIDRVGKRHVEGGRQTARYLFDLYHLSVRYQPLSAFASEHCDDLQIEGLCNWYRSFDRMTMKAELPDIRARTPLEFRDIDRHFLKEIDRLYEGMV